MTFRLDDVQDFYLDNVQIAIIDTFTESGSNLTLGIIGNYFGNDSDLVTSVKHAVLRNNSDSVMEIGNHGWNHENFTGLTLREQELLINQTNSKLYSILGIMPNVFIAPYDEINNITLKALKESGVHVASAGSEQFKKPFHDTNYGLYFLPSTVATGQFNSTSQLFEHNSFNQTMHEIRDGIKDNGISVVTLHPMDYSLRNGSDYINRINGTQIENLRNLLDDLKGSGIKIETMSAATQRR